MQIDLRLGLTAAIVALCACTTCAWAASVSQAIDHFRAGRFSEAVATLEDVIAEAPDDLGARYWLGRAHLEGGDVAAAETAFLAILQAKPQSTDTRYWLAVLHQRQGRIAQARAEVTRILALSPDHQPSLELQERLKAAREDTTAVYYPSEVAPHPYGRRLAVDWGGLPGDVGEIELLSNSLYDYTFSNAPTDWLARSGLWAITSRWTCSPQWSWQGGQAEEGIAALWNKREFAGDVIVEAYLAFKMGLGAISSYKNPNDLNITIHGDGANPSSGYSFMVGAEHNTESRIMKGTQVLAASSDVQALLPVFEDGFPSTYEFHRRWWRVRARLAGTRLQLYLDDKLVVEAEDPEPLQTGHVGLWIKDNGLIVSRLKVYYAGENTTRRPVPGEDALLPPRPRARERAFTMTSTSHPSVQNDFETDLGTFAPTSEIDSVALRLTEGGPSGAGHCLAITNTVPGGTFGTRIVQDKLDLSALPQLSFDYKLPADGTAKTSLYLTIDGELCEIVFSGPPHGTPRAKRLGAIADVIADGGWHHASFDLLNAARVRFGPSAPLKATNLWLGNLCDSDYLLAGFGGNQLGTTIYLDNFALTRPGGPQVKLAFAPDDSVEVQGYAVCVDADPLTEAPEEVTTEDSAASIEAPEGGNVLYAHVRAKTAEGRWSSTQHHRFVVDQAPPQVIAVSPEPGTALTDDPLTIRIVDPGGGSIDLDTLKLAVNDELVELDHQTAHLDVGLGILSVDLREALPAPEDGAEVVVTLAALSDRAGNAMSEGLKWVYHLDFAGDKTPPPAPTLQLASDGYLCAEDFETGIGGFSPYQGSNGAELSLDDSTAASGRRSLRVYNRSANSSFGVQIRKEPFDAGKHRIVSFDYKVPSRLRVDFVVYVNGDWKAIKFKDTDNEVGYIGEVPDVKDDNEWHHAEFNLYEMLRRDDPTAPSLTVRQFVITDSNWKANVRGRTYHLDNFRIVSVVGAEEGLHLSWRAPDISGTFGLSYVLGDAPTTDLPSEALLEGREGTIPSPGNLDGWISAKVQDGAGNWSEPSSWRLQVDNDAPSAAALSPADGESLATSTVELALTDAGPGGVDPGSVVLSVAGKDYTVDNHALTYDARSGKLTWNCETVSPEPVVLPDATSVPIKLKSASDYAGNAVPNAVEWSWTMDYKQDKTAPRLSKLLSRTHPTILTQTFEDGVGGWKNHGGEAGAKVELDTTTAASGQASVKLTQQKAGGTMAAIITSEPFLADRYPLLSFDYMLPAKTRLDIVARMANGKDYAVALSDNPTGAIGSVSGVKADGKWRHAWVDLQALLRRQQPKGALEVEYLYLTDRNSMDNPAGATAHFDNFVIGQIGTRSPVFHWEATDTTGIAGYSYELDREPGTVPDETPEGTERSQRKFPKLDKGRWYFHIRALDGAGNWSETTHYAIMHLTAE